MTVHAKLHLINQYKERNWTPTTLNAMKQDINGMERDIAAIDTEKERLVIRLRMQCIDLVRLHIEEQISKFCTDRVDRGRQRLEHLTEIASAVGDAIMIAEILWILLQFDMERAKARNDFHPILETYRSEMMATDRRLVSKLLISTKSKQCKWPLRNIFTNFIRISRIS